MPRAALSAAYAPARKRR